MSLDQPDYPFAMKGYRSHLFRSNRFNRGRASTATESSPFNEHLLLSRLLDPGVQKAPAENRS
jgi:hypothetical protein